MFAWLKTNLARKNKAEAELDGALWSAGSNTTSKPNSTPKEPQSHIAHPVIQLLPSPQAFIANFVRTLSSRAKLGPLAGVCIRGPKPEKRAAEACLQSVRTHSMLSEHCFSRRASMGA
jgi:hypothetical protein